LCAFFADHVLSRHMRCNYDDQPFFFYSVVYTCAAALPIKRILELQLTQTAAGFSNSKREIATPKTHH